ncbi:50S ribosomal protein L23 [Candidatus Curtissbacteria bacterium RBG_16_39_7]|uniref:Large ribosomal subunit protein uL23 n=1 Tax=Candidatus Curtissbacteria bacterium RBG_16_39_7 TaxID=1797707 RepID=A0A1F5G1N1_9BACT|nr:MAG: 50S ribosomal protein L23 [Candidatus Curtissbacteria bacterium RBG_16_39_7]
MNRSVIRKPIFSEKTQTKAALQVYTFEVEKDATKKDIKRALDKQFSVEVKKVRTRTQKPKRRRTGKRRYEVQTKSFKIAEITLKKDQKIDLWEVPKEEKPKSKKEKKPEKEKEEKKKDKKEKDQPAESQEKGEK